MGKAKKNKDRHSYRHDPLDQQILESRIAKESSRSKIRRKDRKDDKFVDNRLTSEILKQARQQQEDLEEEIGFSHSSKSASLSCLSLSNKPKTEDDSSNLCSILDKERESEVINVSEEDKKSLGKFMDEDFKKSENLAFIKETLTEKQTEIFTLYSDAGSALQTDEKKYNLFKQLVPILEKYRSGKLPKLFKAIPSFNNWEEILYLTEPEKWSAATMYHATRMFSSNLQDKMAQRFYNLVLLPRLRDDIAECKKLNIHLYKALEKALYKPAAFFKGIIIPLCEAEDSTLREATIIGSVIAKYSIPVLHSSAALLRIAEMEYSGVNSIFMRILIEKKYALPCRVVNSVVDHFLKFKEDSSQYPLLWHECLLTFVQIYKTDLSPEQKSNLLKLLNVQRHEKVTPEIRKELESKPDVEEITQHLWKM